MSSLASPTSIYIDLVPGYKNLPACAELPVSTLIRNMWNGCGDDSRLTSFSCFCTDSYSKFSWDIPTAVIASCGPGIAQAQATSAVSVFHNYCANGTTQLMTATLAMTTGSSNSASNPVSTVPGPPTTITLGMAPKPTEAAAASAAIRYYENEPKLWLLLLMFGSVVLRILLLE